MLEGNDANHTPLRVRVSHQSREATAAWLTCDTDVTLLDIRTLFIKLGSTVSLVSMIATRPRDLCPGCVEWRRQGGWSTSLYYLLADLDSTDD